MESLPIDERTQIIMVHSGLGTLVLVLLLVRLWWRRGHPPPGPTQNMSARQASLSTLAHRALYALGDEVRRSADRDSGELLAIWRRLTTSDHVYYMATKRKSDGDVHEYFTPYESPHASFIVFMNALDEVERRIRASAPSETRKEREVHP